MTGVERSPKRRKIAEESHTDLVTTVPHAGKAAIAAEGANLDLAQHRDTHTIDGGSFPQIQDTKSVSDVQDAASAATENNPPQAATATTAATTDPSLSKSQQKKLRRKQEWEAGREERKAWKKEKRKEKNARKRSAKAEESETAQDAANGEPSQASSGTAAKTKSSRHRPVQLPISFIFDCGFDDLMLDKERVSLAAQLTRCYSDNHRAKFRNHMAISSFGSKLKERFDTVLSKHHEKWKGVRFFDGDFVGVAEQAKGWMRGEKGGVLDGAFRGGHASGNDFPPAEAKGSEPVREPAETDFENAETIYLTSDSHDTLTELKPYSTYIIGGLVDRNRHKGICYKRACDRGMKTARLPIGEYMEMTSRFVLATNHVAEIMLRWLEYRDWGKAFMDVVPKRKGGVLKEKGEEVEGEGESEGGIEVEDEGEALGANEEDGNGVGEEDEEVGD